MSYCECEVIVDVCACGGYSTVYREVTMFSHIFSTLGVILQILIPNLCDQDMNRHFLHKHSGKKLCGEKNNHSVEETKQRNTHLAEKVFGKNMTHFQ